ncbi:MAG: amidohydrolase family protein [Kordiimonas sp.]
MIIVKNVDVFDGLSPEIKENQHVVIEGNTICDVTSSEVTSANAHTIDGMGKTLMPGLIDAHYHACLVHVKGYNAHTLPPSLIYPAASRLLEDSLKRGFTSVRDAGGADFGLARATELGLVKGPRIFFSGRPLTHTGGHGEIRSKNQSEPCLCASHSAHLVCVVDGADEVRKAAREEFRKGAHQLKIMMNGGVSTDADPVWLCQFTDTEILAAVEEAKRRRSYVMAHLYMDEQIEKAVKLGIRSVEHGNFLTSETAEFMAKQGAFLVPTLVTYKALAENGQEFGFAEENFAKLAEVSEAGLQSLENAVRAGVQVAFGTDLLGEMHKYQCDEFAIRREIQSPFEILRSATSVAGELLGKGDKLGVLKEGAIADLILVSGKPLEDLSVFNNAGTNIENVIKNGELIA